MPRYLVAFVTALVLVGPPLASLAGCASDDIAKLKWDPPAEKVSPWSGEFAVPNDIHLPSGFRIMKLGPELAQIDYDAFMSCREHLHRTLHWGSWPRADATVEENRKDLERHEREFETREAYAYAVLTMDGVRELGCIYMEPLPDEAPYAVELAYWMTEDEVLAERDEVFMTELLWWFENFWPIDEVTLRQHVENVRGAEVALAAGMMEVGEVEDEHRTFVWRRP